MRLPFRLLLVPLLCFDLVACNPSLQGLCSTSAECPGGTVCESGLCIAITGPGSADAGAVNLCQPACASGLTCLAGDCVMPGVPAIAIAHPIQGAVVGGAPLTVLLETQSPGPISNVEVHLEVPGSNESTLVASGTATSNANQYKAVVDLTQASVTNGDYDLIASMVSVASSGSTAGMTTYQSATVHIVVNKTGPVISFLPVNYPTRPTGSPATGAFLRNEQVVIDVSVNDMISGLGTNLPTLSAAGLPPVTGVLQTGHVYRFTFSGRTPNFRAVTGPIDVTATAVDSVGNKSTAQSTFQLTRLEWTWTKPNSQNTSTAPAVDGALLVIGGDEGHVYGVHRSDGSTAWDETINTKPVGHIAAGAARVYAATSDGHVIGLDPSDTGLSQTQRNLFTCPNGQPQFNQPPLRTLVSGVSIGLTTISASNATQEETLFAFTADGHLQGFRDTAFPGAFTGQSAGCVIETATNAQNVAGVPALLPEGSNVVAFVGGSNGQVHRIAVALPTTVPAGQQEATFTLTNDWSYNAGAAVVSPPALGLPHGAEGLVFSREDGVMQAIDLNSNTLWSIGPLVPNAGVRASPVLGDGFAYLLDEKGDTQKLALQGGTSTWTQPAVASASSTSANAAPLVGQDGQVYIPGGTQVMVVNSLGYQEWTYDEQAVAQWTPGLAVDSVTPAMSCDGTLYIVATGSGNAYVHAVITDSTSGLATSGWPKTFHDARNTGNASQPLVGSNGTCTD